MKTPLPFKLAGLASMALAAGVFAQPATATDEVAQLRAQILQLSRRLDQLQQAQPQGAPQTTPQAQTQPQALTERLDEVESSVRELQQPGALEEALAGVSVEGSVLLTAQNASRVASGRSSHLSTRTDLLMQAPAGKVGDAQGKLVGHLRLGKGSGVDLDSMGFSTTTDATAPGSAFSRPVLMEGYYHLSLPLARGQGEIDGLEWTVGRIDPFGFFDGNNAADDESEGFLNLAFVHNPLLDMGGAVNAGDDGASPGMRLAYVSDLNGTRHWGLSVGSFSSGDGQDLLDLHKRAFTIGQLEYSGRTLGNLEGAWRLYSWHNSGIANTDGTLDKRSGWGLSLDQQVSPALTLFGRYGRARAIQTIDYDRALTVGATLSGKAWGRAADGLGWASGQIKATAQEARREKIHEIFYRWQAGKHFQFTPHVQRIATPSGVEGAGTTVIGLRSKFSF